MNRILVMFSLAAAIGAAHAGTVQRTVGGGDTESLRRNLDRGEYIMLTLQGNGRTNLDLYVFGPSRAGWSKCKRPGDFEGCGFEVEHSGTYRIEIRNRGTRSNTFTLDIDRS